MASGEVAARARARDDRRPVLPPQREGAPQHHGGPPRRAAGAAPDRADASTCKPVKGAAVDIWHASAAGRYSGEAANDTVGPHVLRGIQRTDARGLALFETVYPGWYTGRAVHIHVKVHVGGTSSTPVSCSSATPSPTRSTGARRTRRAAARTCSTRTTRSTPQVSAGQPAEDERRRLCRDDHDGRPPLLTPSRYIRPRGAHDAARVAVVRRPGRPRAALRLAELAAATSDDRDLRRAR